MIPKGSYLIIQNVQPQVDGGRYAVKREVGDAKCSEKGTAFCAPNCFGAKRVPSVGTAFRWSM